MLSKGLHKKIQGIEADEWPADGFEKVWVDAHIVRGSQRLLSYLGTANKPGGSPSRCSPRTALTSVASATNPRYSTKITSAQKSDSLD